MLSLDNLTNVKKKNTTQHRGDNNNERQQLFSWQLSYHITQHLNIIAQIYLDSYLKKPQMEVFSKLW